LDPTKKTKPVKPARISTKTHCPRELTQEKNGTEAEGGGNDTSPSEVNEIEVTLRKLSRK
jgi:hypothetical protein